MKVLCVCTSGNVRSVTLARLLRKRGAEALCCGVDKGFQSPTIQMLASWADVIYAQADSVNGLRLHFYNTYTDGIDSRKLEDKISTVFDVGLDDWKIPDHPDLLRRMRDMVMEDPQWQ
jgi:hypothetical protein